jgi:hypothetical protein
MQKTEKQSFPVTAQANFYETYCCEGLAGD